MHRGNTKARPSLPGMLLIIQLQLSSSISSSAVTTASVPGLAQSSAGQSASVVLGITLLWQLLLTFVLLKRSLFVTSSQPSSHLLRTPCCPQLVFLSSVFFLTDASNSSSVLLFIEFHWGLVGSAEQVARLHQEPNIGTVQFTTCTACVLFRFHAKCLFTFGCLLIAIAVVWKSWLMEVKWLDKEVQEQSRAEEGAGRAEEGAGEGWGEKKGGLTPKHCHSPLTKYAFTWGVTRALISETDSNKNGQCCCSVSFAFCTFEIYTIFKC